MGKFFSKRKPNVDADILRDQRRRGYSEPIIPTQPIIAPQRRLSLLTDHRVGNKVISILPDKWVKRKKKEKKEPDPYAHLTDF